MTRRSPSSTTSGDDDRLEALFDRGQLASGIAGVDGPGRLDQENFQAVTCTRAMRDSLRHDEQLTGAELNVAVPHLDDQPALEDQEELVGLSVLVPHELTIGLGDLDVVVIEGGDDFGLQRSSNSESFSSRLTLFMESPEYGQSIQ